MPGIMDCYDRPVPAEKGFTTRAASWWICATPTNERQSRSGWGVLWALQSLVTQATLGIWRKQVTEVLPWLFLRFEHNLINGHSFQP